MKNAQPMTLIAALMLALCMTGSALAAPILIQNGSGNAFAGWTNAPREGAGSPEGSAPNMSGSQLGQPAVTFTADTTGQFQPPSDVYYTDAFDEGMALNGTSLEYGGGDAVGVTGLQMDFYAGAAGAPDGLGFYFHLDDGGTDVVWYYGLSVAGIGADSWTSFTAGFGVGGTGWSGFEMDVNNEWSAVRDSEDFLSDLAAFDQLGIYIVYPTDQSGQSYGISDFGFTVPEPQTYIVLGMALLSLAFLFRKRITDSLAEARAMIQM